MDTYKNQEITSNIVVFDDCSYYKSCDGICGKLVIHLRLDVVLSGLELAMPTVVGQWLIDNCFSNGSVDRMTYF